MSVTFPVTGATYKLKAEVLRKIKLTLDIRHHDEAKLVECTSLLGPWVAILDRELAGSKVWELSKLAWVRGAKEVRREEIPLAFRKSLLPAHRVNLGRGGFRSNADFGFTPEQAAALDELEAAIEDNRHPCIGGDRRRQCRARVIAAHQQVVKLGLLNALTPNERDECLQEFLGNTVLK